MEVMIEAAIQKGLTYLCFTDHMDYNYPGQYKLPFVFDPEPYHRELDRLIPFYKNDITLCRGVELGIQPGAEEQCRRLLEEYSFDFVIASTHLIDGIDPYYPDYWNGRSMEASVRRCLEQILENIRLFPDFDTLGHMDYIMRYCPGGLAGYCYEKFAPEFDAILKELIALGKGIEINTNSYRYGFPCPHPLPEVIRRYFELGGTYITIGSDAHVPEHLAQSFDRTEALLQSLGLEEYSIFQNRRRISLKL